MNGNDNNGNGCPQEPHNLHSFADTFHAPAPPTPNNTTTIPPPPPRKKAKRRRKRHVPPGPAGVWFQSQLHNNAVGGESSGRRMQQDENRNSTLTNKRNVAPAPDVSSCPAWMCMQHSLNQCTPYLPPYLSIQERYQHLRPIIPQDYLLLPELQHSCQASLQGRKLLVLVHAAAVPYHSYWTVELRDECGASLKAWMDPEENYEKMVAGLLQMGVVWLLRDLRILVDSSSSKQQWLLITLDSIEQTWTPQQANKEFSNAEYIEWMTKRSQMSTTTTTLSSSSIARQEAQQHGHPDDEEEEIVHQEEEEDDVALIIPRNFANRVVTPHPSAFGNNRPRTNDNSTSSVQRQGHGNAGDTPQVSSNGDSRRVSMETVAASNGPPPRASHDESREATNAISFSQFLSPNTKATPAGTCPKSCSSTTSVPNPYANRTTNTQRPQGEHAMAAHSNPTRSRAAVPTAATSSTAVPTNLAVPVPPDHTMASSPVPPPPPSSRPSRDFSKFKSPTTPDTSQTHRPLATQSNPNPPQAHSTKPSNSTHSDKNAPPVSVVKEQRQLGSPADAAAKQSDAENATTTTPPARPRASSKSASDSSSTVASRLNMTVLSQFTARSATENVTSLSQSSKTISPKQSKKNKTPPKTPTRGKRKQRTPRSNKQQKATTPNETQAPSNMWFRADASMLNMSDDEDEQDGLAPKPPQGQMQPAAVDPLRQKENDTPVDTTQKDSSSPGQHASLLFQASAFAGIDMDGLFDDDDDDD